MSGGTTAAAGGGAAGGNQETEAQPQQHQHKYHNKLDSQAKNPGSPDTVHQAQTKDKEHGLTDPALHRQK